MGPERRQLVLERGQFPLLLLAFPLAGLALPVDFRLKLLDLPAEFLVASHQGLRTPLGLPQGLLESGDLGLVTPLGFLVHGLEPVVGGDPLRPLLTPGVGLATELLALAVERGPVPVDLPPEPFELVLPVLRIGFGPHLDLAPVLLGLPDQVAPLLFPLVFEGLALRLPEAPGLLELPSQGLVPALGFDPRQLPAVLLGPERLQLRAEAQNLLLELVSLGAQGLPFFSPRLGGLEFRLTGGEPLLHPPKVRLVSFRLGPGGIQLLSKRADLVGQILERPGLDLKPGLLGPKRIGFGLERPGAGPERLGLGAKSLHVLLEPIPMAADRLEVLTQRREGLGVGLASGSLLLGFPKVRPEPLGLDPGGVELFSQRADLVDLRLQLPGPVAKSVLLGSEGLDFGEKALNLVLEPVPVGAQGLDFSGPQFGGLTRGGPGLLEFRHLLPEHLGLIADLVAFGPGLFEVKA